MLDTSIFYLVLWDSLVSATYFGIKGAHLFGTVCHSGNL